MKKYIAIAGSILIAACNNNTSTENNTAENVNPGPATINYNVVKVYPHDTTTYTEGLEFHDNYLLESGGNYGESKLVKTDLQTGKPIKQLNLDKKYFGEGITLLNGKIYQMTYKEGVCFVYDAKTFKLLKQLHYDGEGWGMTNNGKEIIMDDGSNHIYFRDPETFNVVKTITVSDNLGPIDSVNELELIDGFLYANIYLSNTIIKIDTTTGRVVGKMDLTGIREKSGVAPDSSMPDDGLVLNGIAYDSTKKSLYVTGKDWPALFEIKLN